VERREDAGRQKRSIKPASPPGHWTTGGFPRYASVMAELGLPDRFWSPTGIERGGDSFFAVLGPPAGALPAYQKLLALRDLFSANRTPLGRAQALALDTIIRDLTRSMARISVIGAEDATRAARGSLERSRKRPVMEGARTPLASLITSKPITEFPPLGEVGVGEMETLSQHPGWRVQELGSTHLVRMTNEKRIHGFFQPGDAPPDPAQFRVHPVFRTGGGPRFIAKREAPAKSYLRAGAVVAGLKRRQRIARLDVRLSTEIRAIRAGTHPQVRRSEQALRRGGTFRRI
jgi:hypothetical protein